MSKATARKAPRSARTDAAPAAPARTPRGDGWVNVATAIGMAGRDKTVGASLISRPLTQLETENIWRGDDMAAKMVEVLPSEMTREGFTLSIPSLDETADDPISGLGEENQFTNDAADLPPGNVQPFPPEPAKPEVGEVPDLDDSGKQAAEEIEAKLEALEWAEAFKTALEYERAHGGAAILIGANDGQTDWTKPLDLTNIQSVDFLTVLTPRECFAVSYYNDIRKPKYGLPAIYRIIPDAIGTSWRPDAQPIFSNVEVHESRLICFRGLRVSRRQLIANRSWGDSIYVRTLRVLEQFSQSYGSAAILISDFAQAVFKIKGLAELLEGDENGVLINRIQSIDMMRSSARAILIDSEEEFKREQTPVSGLSDLLDRLNLRLAASVETPVTLLFGQAPAGLNATGASDIRGFYDRVKGLQIRKLKPALKYLIKIIMLAQGSPTDGTVPKVWDLKFAPLWQLTELETAQLRLAVAQADAIYITNQVYTPEEVAGSRAGGDGWSMDTVIDHEGRKALADSYADDKAEANKRAAQAASTATDPTVTTDPPKQPTPGAGAPGNQQGTQNLT